MQLPRGLLIGCKRTQGQALVEYALILALIVLVVILTLLLTGKQITNLYSNVSATMCNYHVGC